MQKAQYQQLSRHIESVRQARHDLRQHLNVIDHYLNSGKTEELKAYIAQYRQMLPPDTFCTWCENYAAAVVSMLRSRNRFRRTARCGSLRTL